MAEWFKVHAWKACVRLKPYRGFESLSLRQVRLNCINRCRYRPASATQEFNGRRNLCSYHSLPRPRSSLPVRFYSYSASSFCCLIGITSYPLEPNIRVLASRRKVPLLQAELSAPTAGTRRQVWTSAQVSRRLNTYDLSVSCIYSGWATLCPASVCDRQSGAHGPYHPDFERARRFCSA